MLAYHCCQADVLATVEPARFVRSIAAMIASQLPDYAARLNGPALEKGPRGRSLCDRPVQRLRGWRTHTAAAAACPRRWTARCS